MKTSTENKDEQKQDKRGIALRDNLRKRKALKKEQKIKNKNKRD